MEKTKRELLCPKCLIKIRAYEAEEKMQYRIKKSLKIKVVQPDISGKVKINKK